MGVAPVWSRVEHPFDQTQVELAHRVLVLLSENMEGAVAKSGLPIFLDRLVPGLAQRSFQAVTRQFPADPVRHLGQV